MSDQRKFEVTKAGMNRPLIKDEDYSAWLKELKNKVRLVQIKAAVKVNFELLQFYWELGADIVEKQATAKWGEDFLSNLSHDLMAEFPDMRGFSKRNLELIRKWYCFWSAQDEIAKQLATQIPWWHNVVILTKTKNTDEALFYVQKTIGVSEYIITKNLPDEFRSSLPSIEEIEAELSGVGESQ